MPKTASQWSDQICQALTNVDPAFSVEVGDPIRKVIDAVGSVAAAIDINSQVNMSFFDIDSKTGADLDALASWLGFGRRIGIRAVGTVRFYIDSPAKLSISIPAGTQVTNGNMVFETTSSSVLSQYDTEVFVRIQCTTTGVAGNVNAYAINQILSNVSNSYDMQVENQLNIANGADAESDAELRKRIRQTFLRNIAGTEDAYRGVSDRVNGTRRVNVVGPVEYWEEQLEVVKLTDAQGGGYGFQSMIPCSKYTWPRQNYLVREPNTENEKVYTEGVDYEIDTSKDMRHPIVRIKMSEDMLHLDDKTGTQLDAIGEALQLPRFSGVPAQGTVTIGFDTALRSDVTIKAGARIKSASGDVFNTLKDVVIYSGKMNSGSIPVESEEFKAIDIASGTDMTFMDRTGFNCKVSDKITGGSSAWSDAAYRTEIIKEFQRRISLSEGDFLFWKHEYTPVDSRNEPAANPPLVNKVDVFVDGQDFQPIREVSQIATIALNNDPTSQWYCKNFYFEDGAYCIDGQKIEVLGYNPVLRVPDSISINGILYKNGTDFRLVKNQVLTRGSVREIAALAWTAGKSIPEDGSFTDISYDYNRTVFVTEQLLDTNRQICTDVLCHEAKRVGLEINLVVQNVLGESDADMLASINALLDTWTSNLDFGQWIQFSDIEMIVRQAPGVDACRIATDEDTWRDVTVGDDAGKKIKSGIQTHETFKAFLTSQHDQDFRLWESMIPDIFKVNVVRCAANTYPEDYRPGSGGSKPDPDPDPKPDPGKALSLTVDKNALSLKPGQTDVVVATVLPSTWTGELQYTASGCTVVTSKISNGIWNVKVTAGNAKGIYPITLRADTKTAVILLTVTESSGGTDPGTGPEDPDKHDHDENSKLGLPVYVVNKLSDSSSVTGQTVKSPSLVCALNGDSNGANPVIAYRSNGETTLTKDINDGVPMFAIGSVSSKTDSRGKAVRWPSVLAVTGTKPPTVMYSTGTETEDSDAWDGIPVHVVNSANDTVSKYGQAIVAPCILVLPGTNPPQIIYKD